MLKRIIGIGSALALYLAVPMLNEFGVAGVSAQAAEEDEEQPYETRRVPTISESVYKKLSEAQEAIDAEDMATARKVLTDMTARPDRLNGNELGQVYNMLGFVYFNAENYTAAIDAYKEVLAQGEDIQAGLEVQTLYTLAQLSFVNEQYPQALSYMETWITKANNPGADPHIFMCQVYYQMDDYRSATNQCETGIEIARERGVPSKEQWWALLNFLYYEQENWPRVLETLEVLVKRFPKTEYWRRLAGIHGQIGNDEESLWTYEAADVGGFLERQSDFTNYAGLLMQQEVPFRAARVLERGIENDIVERTDRNLQSLGQAWQLAQEVDKAIPVFLQAAKLSDEGRIYERLANLYLEDDQFESCVDAADGALDKGGLRAPQNMYVVRGMCQYNQDNLSSARESFVECRTLSRREDDDANRRICQQWITHIDREVEREEQLRRAAI